MKMRLSVILMTCLAFACDKDDVEISDNLKGNWTWKSTCGGVVGCVSSTPDNQMTMKISETEVLTTISNNNGTTSTSSSYQIIDKRSQDGNTIYTIQLSSGIVWTIAVQKDDLSIEWNLIFSSYHRL